MQRQVLLLRETGAHWCGMYGAVLLDIRGG